MSAQTLDGRMIAGRVRIAVAKEVEAFAARFGGAVPGLATILVGDDPASAVYVNGKQKACREVGMQGFNFPLPADAPRAAVVELIERLNADPEVSGILLQLPVPDHLEGAEAVVIGRSNLFGKPMAQLLLGANATVTMCHSRTRDLAAVCRRADVLIAAVGRARMVKGDWVKPGATVIDVGMNRLNSTPPALVGDVDFAAVSEVAGAIT